MGSCKQVYRYICENLDAALTSERCRRIRAHLAACPKCRAYLDSVKKTVVLYRTSPSPGISPSARRKLYGRLSREIPGLVPADPPRKRSNRSRHS